MTRSAIQPLIRLRITADGRITGLWNDDVDFPALGRLTIRRASHVEFDNTLQQWTVREAVPREWWRRWVQRVVGRALGRVVYRADSRQAAIAWEERHFMPSDLLRPILPRMCIRH